MTAGRLMIYGAIIVPLLVWLWWPASEQGDHVVVALDASGTLSVDGQITPPSQFAARLDQALKARPGKPVELRADPAATTTALMPVMEALRVAGVEQVQFSARSGE